MLTVAHWSPGVYVKAVTGQRKPGRTSSVTHNPCILQRRWLWVTAEHIRVSLAVPDGVVFQGAWTASNGVALLHPASPNARFWAEHYGIFIIKRIRNAAFSWPSHDEPNPSYSWPSPLPLLTSLSMFLLVDLLVSMETGAPPPRGREGPCYPCLKQS